LTTRQLVDAVDQQDRRPCRQLAMHPLGWHRAAFELADQGVAAGQFAVAVVTQFDQERDQAVPIVQAAGKGASGCVDRQPRQQGRLAGAGLASDQRLRAVRQRGLDA
jgi:hypothetical protein